jgi:hypothetical protein
MSLQKTQKLPLPCALVSLITHSIHLLFLHSTQFLPFLSGVLVSFIITCLHTRSTVNVPISFLHSRITNYAVWNQFHTPKHPTYSRSRAWNVQFSSPQRSAHHYLRRLAAGQHSVLLPFYSAVFSFIRNTWYLSFFPILQFYWRYISYRNHCAVVSLSMSLSSITKPQYRVWNMMYWIPMYTCGHIFLLHLSVTLL